MIVGRNGVETPDVQLPAVELYDGTVTVKFDEATHRYSVQDRGVGLDWFHPPSVTRVLGRLDKSGPLLNWSGRCVYESFRELIHPGVSYTEKAIEQIGRMVQFAHEAKKKRAGEIGHAVHAWIESFLGHRMGLSVCPPIPTNDLAVRSACTAARDFIVANNLMPVSVERILYSRTHRVISTTDFAGAVCKMSDRLAILDWKSSNSIDNPGYEWQLAAYAAMWKEMTGQSVEDRYLVRLDKEDGKAYPRLLPREDLGKDWMGFCGLLQAHNRLQGMEAA